MLRNIFLTFATSAQLSQVEALRTNDENLANDQSLEDGIVRETDVDKRR